MSLPRDLATIVLQWVARAENDYLNAEYVITMKDACPYDTVALVALRIFRHERDKSSDTTPPAIPGPRNPEQA